jgi:hypothetical protein
MERRTFLGCLALALSDPAFAAPTGNFHAIYGDVRLQDAFYLFLQNIFHLYPEARFHQLIIDAVAQFASDEQIYEALIQGLPGIKTFGSELTYAVPALRLQKHALTNQAQMFLGSGTEVQGYLEIGSLGRYVRDLAERVRLSGPIWVVNDIAPGSGPADILERGQWAQVGTFLPLGNYDPIDGAIADESLDLVSNFIGFHHCPDDRLQAFLGSIHRVLRPGGRLLVREHDVSSPIMDTFVALAHDVFNAGVRLSWADNATQVRGFRSVADWTRLIEAVGFARNETLLMQRHDPTDNMLLDFRRV